MSFTSPAKNVDALSLSLGEHVADIGAGSGFYTYEIAKRVGKNGTVFAIDIQKELLDRIKTEALKQKLSQIEIVWGDADEEEGTKLGALSVDAVLISNLLFQIGKKDALAREVARILKPRGRLLIIDWNGSYGGLGPEQKMVVTKNEAEGIFSRAGFKTKKIFDAGDHHYGIIFEKAA